MGIIPLIRHLSMFWQNTYINASSGCNRRFSTIIFSRASANVEVYSCFSKTSTDRRRSTDVSIITKNINFITEKFDALRRLCDIGGHFSPLAMVVNYNRRYVDDLVTFLIFM